MSSLDMFSSSPSAAAGQTSPRCWAEGRLQTCLPLASSCRHNMRPPERACQWLGSSSCLGRVCMCTSGKADPAWACEHPSRDALAMPGCAGSRMEALTLKGVTRQTENRFWDSKSNGVFHSAKFMSSHSRSFMSPSLFFLYRRTSVSSPPSCSTDMLILSSVSACSPPHFFMHR